jgi:putative membrane protein insertion efficiency factor
MGHCHTPARVSRWGGVRAARIGTDAFITNAGEVTRRPGAAASVAARVLLLALRLYQGFLSPLMPSSCKFYPSCSRYAYQAIEIHGGRRGSWLALRRLLRCRPFSPGGIDLVPEREALGELPVARR